MESMQTAPALPGHLGAVLRGRRDSRRAHELREALWGHYEGFLAGRGYRIAWDGDRLPAPDLRAAADPFSPGPDEAFAAATAGRGGVRWGGPRAPFVMGAYDRRGRLVVLKIVAAGGREVAMLRRLGAGAGAGRGSGGNHTIPVLEYVGAGEWVFVAMPAWELTLRECGPVGAAGDYAAIAGQCFEGLAYMHGQRVAHLDIYAGNVLANHVAHRPAGPFLRAFDLRVAFIDFEHAVRVPREQPLVDVRSLPPTYHALPEVGARARHVDPFAADVFALGRALQDHVRAQTGEHTHGASRYLALLDCMTRREPARRPSIEQALQELRSIARDM